MNLLLFPLLTACNTSPATDVPAAEAEGPTEITRLEAPPAAPADVAAPPADAKKTESGLAYRIIHDEPGSKHPVAEASVVVDYTGWTTDGEQFDTSIDKARPATFPLNRVIAGWTEGLQLMTAGDRYVFWIPEEIAYQGRSGKPAGMLVFDVQMHSFTNPPPPVPAPADVAEAPSDATVTESGLAYKVLSPGTGAEHPVAEATVEVHYTGWTTDGKMFDSSRSRGEPASFPLKRVIAGWTEGVQLMKQGETARFWIPKNLAYGDRPPPAPQGMLVFDIELLSFKNPPPPIPAPDDVAEAPQDATTTESGLAYKVLSKGDGTENPTKADRVKVHYTGWTTDGKMFDSSLQRGEPAVFGLRQVIAGWTEGLQLMVAGDKTRFWIPEDLAYRGRPSKPQGTLVFDVELIEVIKPAPASEPATP